MMFKLNSMTGRFLGGCDATLKAAKETDLLSTITVAPRNYDYDILVIGGGSGKFFSPLKV